MREACASEVARSLQEVVLKERDADARAARDCWGSGRLTDVIAWESDDGDDAPVAGMSHATWRAAPDALPPAIPETGEWRGQAAQEPGRAELRYFFRRRADTEDPECLACESFPEPTHQPPQLRARPVHIHDSWAEGAPPPPISIEQLFYTQPGVYAGIQRTVAVIAAQLRTVEACARQGEESGAIPGHMPEVYGAECCQPCCERTRI